MSLENLCKTAKTIDKIDAITGPLSVALYNSGSDVLYNVGVVISVAELTFLKMPFLLGYLAKTKDVTGSSFILAKEIVANSNRVSGIIDIVPFYYMVTTYQQQRGKII